MTAEAALEVALHLADRGFVVFPCLNSKAPACPGGFRAATRDADDLRMLWAAYPGVLVGLPTGELNTIAILDIDSTKHREAADWLQHFGPQLGETWTVETRSGGRHWFFQYRAGLRCSVSKIATGVDVRGDGGYVICWSAHGYPVISDAPLAPWPAILDDILGAHSEAQFTVSPSSDQLKAVECNTLTGIVRELPNDRTFDDRTVWVGLAHALAAAFTDDLDMAEALWLEHAAKRPQTEGEPQRVWDSLQAPHSVGARWIIAKAKAARIDTQAYEVAEVAAAFAAAGPISVDRDASTTQILSPKDQLIVEFNQQYMVVNEAGKAVIYAPRVDRMLKRTRFDRITFDDFRRLYLNRNVLLGNDPKGNAVFGKAANVWLESPWRREFLGGVMFDPASRECDPAILNLWTGFAVQPLPGDWSLLKDHIRTVICGGNQTNFDYLIGWMARLLQFPAEQGEVAVVLKGEEGTGKGTMAKALLSVVGRHGVAISNSRHLVGNFNAHLRDCVFLFADEAFFAGDKSHIGVLKSLITEPYLTVEPKYHNAVQTPNFLHVMMASNEEWVVPASLTARRFFVLDVLDSRRGDHGYFAAIWTQMSAGGYEGMLHELLTHDISKFNVRNVPLTEGLQTQRKLSLPVPETWWMDCLYRGSAIYSWSEKWRDDSATDLLFASYRDFAARANERHPMGREMFGKFMRRMGAVAKRLPASWRDDRLAVGAVTAGVPGPTAAVAAPGPACSTTSRPQGFHLGSLADARAEFCKATGLSVEWPEDDVETEEPRVHTPAHTVN